MELVKSLDKSYGYEYFSYYAPIRVAASIEGVLHALLKDHFEGATDRVARGLERLERFAGVPQVAALDSAPAFQFLRFLVLGRLNRAQESQQAIAACVRLGGVPHKCANDLAVLIAESGETVQAQRFLATHTASQSDEPGIQVNLLALAVTNGDGAGIESAGRRLLNRRQDVLAMVRRSEATGFHRGAPAYEFLTTFVTAVLRQVRDVDWDGLGPAASARDLVLLLDEMVAGLDAMPAIRRDMYLLAVLAVSRVDAATLGRALAWRVRQGGAHSRARAVLAAAIAFTLDDAACERDIAELARTDDGALPLMALAMGHGQRGEIAEEHACIERLIGRFPGLPRFLFMAANNRFRAGERESADALAHAAVAAYAEGVADGLRADARSGADALAAAIAAGLHERAESVDPYAAKDWVRAYWDQYHFEFARFTPRQDFSAFLNHLYVATAGRLLAERPRLRSVLNLGSFCGYFDHLLATRNPDARVIGYDREDLAIDLNRRHFAAPNLEFRAGHLDGVLAEATRHGPTLLVHVRTCTLMYPAGVEATYEKCRAAGVEAILGIESTGYSWQLDGFPDPFDGARPPVVPLGVMVDHNYRRLLADGGYRMIEQSLYAYPVVFELRPMQEQFVPMCFVAASA